MFQTLTVAIAVPLCLSLVGIPKAQSFDLAFQAAESDQDRQTRRVLETAERLERSVQGLNRIFDLPETVTVVIGGDLGPLHDPTHRLIQIPYSLISELLGICPEQEDALDVVVFALYHEVGHALIDMLDLNIAAEIEEAADSVATLLSVELMSDGGGPVYTTARMIVSTSELHPWFGEAKAARRSQRLICWTLGSDPGRLGWVAEDAGFEGQEADRCPSVYEEMRRFWVEMLAPYLR